MVQFEEKKLHCNVLCVILYKPFVYFNSKWVPCVNKMRRKISFFLARAHAALTQHLLGWGMFGMVFQNIWRNRMAWLTFINPLHFRFTPSDLTQYWYRWTFFFCRESTANNAIRLPNWNIETMALNYSLFTYCNTFFSLSAVDIWPRSSSKIKWYFSAHLIRNGRFGVRLFFEVQGKEKQICVRELQIL